MAMSRSLRHRTRALHGLSAQPDPESPASRLSSSAVQRFRLDDEIFEREGIGNQRLGRLFRGNDDPAPVPSGVPIVQRITDQQYQQFLTYQGGDYEDFEQHYAPYDPEDYGEQELQNVQDNAEAVFGVPWADVDARRVAHALRLILIRARGYDDEDEDAAEELAAIQNQQYIAGLAIYYRVPEAQRMQFSYQSDRITQALAQE